MTHRERDQGTSHDRSSFSIEEVVIEQHWRGTVDEVRDDEFSVVLTSQLEDAEEFTTIYKSQISEKDQPLIAENASFEWIVGYIDDASGRRIGVSVIEFAPPIALTEEERLEAMKSGAEMSEALKAGQSDRLTLD